MPLYRSSMLFACALLAGCVGPQGVPLGAPEQRVPNVPEIGASFQPIPLKVAAYIAPQAANALNYSDWRKTGQPFLSTGPIGPGLLAGVEEYFPKVFAEASVINDFPDPALLLEDLDAVIVFESASSSGYSKGGVSTGYNDTLLNVGVYTPQGERLVRYQVIATHQFPYPKSLNIVANYQAGYPIATESNKVAVRLALHRFPRGSVTTAAQRGPQNVDAATLAERRRAIFAAIDAAAPPKPPGTPTDAMQHATGQAAQVNMMMSMSSMLNTRMATVPGVNPGLNALSQGMHQAMLSANSNPNAPASNSGAFWLEFLGGVTAAAQQRRAAMNVARSPAGGGPASAGVCQELARLAKECRARQASMGGGTTGQAGSFAQCAQTYGNAYNARCTR